MKPRRLFIVGAGASLPAPAGLPLFDSLRGTLCEWMGVEQIIGGRMPPEVFMNCVAQGLGQDRLSAWLVDTLSPDRRTVGGVRPNAVHAVLAKALGSGDIVWSLNVDELVEQSVEDNDRELFSILSERLTAHRGVQGSPVKEARLLKPHGTLAMRNFVFRTSQVIRPMPRSWATRLDSDLAVIDEVVFIGYRGADVDLRVPLDSALQSHQPKVRWFTRSSDEWLDACRYLPTLAGLDVDLRIDPNPSADFVRWADEVSLSGFVTEQQRWVLDDTRQRGVDPPKGRPRLSRALLLELLNEVALAEDAFVAEMARGRHLGTCSFRFLKLRWYAGDPRFNSLRAIDRAGLTRLLPRSASRRVRRAHLMYLSSVTGDHETALSLANRSDKRDPATWIVIAKAQRNAGNCQAALDAALKASKQAAPETEVDDSAKTAAKADEKAHAVFEQVFALTWLGRFQEARASLTTLYDGYDAQARIRWIGWAKYLEGGLRLLDGDGAAAATELYAAMEFFEADDTSGRRKKACEVLIAAAKRLQGDTSTSARIWLPSGADPNIVELAATLDFEVAESAREALEHDKAACHYASAADLGRRPLLRCAALLGIAELEPATSERATDALREARDIATRCQFRRLQADAVVTAHRLGLPRNDALRQLAEFADVLPGWDSNGASAPDAFLDNEHHRIVCVW
jgi:tetratricopeptide (TPR) repeat protein